MDWSACFVVMDGLYQNQEECQPIVDRIGRLYHPLSMVVVQVIQFIL
jgi:hypothetical protein